MFLKDKQFQGFEADVLAACTSMDLMTAKGACGSFSMVLARILQGYQFPVRIAQMKSDGCFGSHIVVEVLTESWLG